MPESEKKPARIRKSQPIGDEAQPVGINAAQFEAMLAHAIQSNREETAQQLAELIKSVGEMKEIMSQVRDELTAFYTGDDDEEEGDDELREQVETIMSQPEPDPERQPGGSRTFVPFTMRNTGEPSAIWLEPREGNR